MYLYNTNKLNAPERFEWLKGKTIMWYLSVSAGGGGRTRTVLLPTDFDYFSAQSVNKYSIDN